MDPIELPIEGELTRLDRLRNQYFDKFGEFPPRWNSIASDEEFADAIFLAINTEEPLGEEYEEEDGLY